MTVKDLIEQLSQYDPLQEVLLTGGPDHSYFKVQSVRESTVEYSHKHKEYFEVDPIMLDNGEYDTALLETMELVLEECVVVQGA